MKRAAGEESSGQSKVGRVRWARARARQVGRHQRARGGGNKDDGRRKQKTTATMPAHRLQSLQARFGTFQCAPADFAACTTCFLVLRILLVLPPDVLVLPTSRHLRYWSWEGREEWKEW